jgi:hypothetical protein
MNERKKNFFGDYLARSEPDKILCRAGTFGYKSTAKKHWIPAYAGMTRTGNNKKRKTKTSHI